MKLYRKLSFMFILTNKLTDLHFSHWWAKKQFILSWFCFVYILYELNSSSINLRFTNSVCVGNYFHQNDSIENKSFVNSDYVWFGPLVSFAFDGWFIFNSIFRLGDRLVLFPLFPTKELCTCMWCVFIWRGVLCTLRKPCLKTICLQFWYNLNAIWI